MGTEPPYTVVRSSAELSVDAAQRVLKASWRRRSKAKEAAHVESWNAAHPVGTLVFRVDDIGGVHETKTTTPAWLMGGHTAMVTVDGISGGYTLTRMVLRAPVAPPEVACKVCDDGDHCPAHPPTTRLHVGAEVVANGWACPCCDGLTRVDEDGLCASCGATAHLVYSPPSPSPGDAAAAKPAPIPMVLHCPECRTRHIDEEEFATKPHHTHSCQGCGLTWRPSVVHTVGVQFLPGFKNEAPGDAVVPGCSKPDCFCRTDRPGEVLGCAAALVRLTAPDGWPAGSVDRESVVEIAMRIKGADDRRRDQLAALKVALDEAAELIGSRRRAWGPGEADAWLTRYAALKGAR